MIRVDVDVRDTPRGWVADITVRGERTTSHRVRISRAEHERYGGGDVTDLLRRSLDFLLAREPNASILREFDLGEIERYFPEFAKAIVRR